MDLDNVMCIFKTLSKLSYDEVQECAEIADGALAYIRDRLKADPEGGDIKRCEYAAACVAYYDYTVLSLMEDKKMVTMTGSATEVLKSDHRIVSARALRDEAIARISGLLIDGDFVFQSIRG